MDLFNLENIDHVIKMVAILFALFHFLVGLLLYKEVSRMNKVFTTKYQGLFQVIILLYILTLLGVVGLYAVL